jgi:hypothetical protein
LRHCYVCPVKPHPLASGLNARSPRVAKRSWADSMASNSAESHCSVHAASLMCGASLAVPVPAGHDRCWWNSGCCTGCRPVPAPRNLIRCLTGAITGRGGGARAELRTRSSTCGPLLQPTRSRRWNLGCCAGCRPVPAPRKLIRCLTGAITGRGGGARSELRTRSSTCDRRSLPPAQSAPISCSPAVTPHPRTSIACIGYAHNIRADVGQRRLTP